MSTLLPADGAQATYLYDFGDGWEHLITLTDVLDGDPSAVGDLASPVLTDGEGVCPPEDVGGIGGHAQVLERVAARDAASGSTRMASMCCAERSGPSRSGRSVRR